MLNVLLLLLSLVSLAYSSCSNSVIPGQITYSYNGASTTGYIIQAGGSQSWGSVATSGSQVTVGLGPRFYLANSCATAFSPTVFQKFNLIGSSVTVSFTVNLNNVGCGQNAAFYLVGMPASSAGSNGDYYCDANCVGGYCCTEMDLMEANRHAIQITPHKCSSATSGCDGGGCARNTQSITNGYGPSSSYTINSASAFQIALTFKSSGGQLSSITSVISQNGKSITLTHDSSCGSGYLSGMSSALTSGVVPVWSYWSGSMSWLDSPACSSDTSDVSTSQFIFSSLSVSGAATVTPVAPPPPPPVTPSPPANQYCGKNGCTINADGTWVEFTPPAGYSNPPSTSTVKCTQGTFSCSWYAAGSKYQCNPSPSICTNPIPYYNGAICPYASSETVDASALGNMGGLSTTGIAVVAAVVCVVIAVIIVIVVIVIVKKRQTMENV